MEFDLDENGILTKLNKLREEFPKEQCQEKINNITRNNTLSKEYHQKIVLISNRISKELMP